MQLGFLIISQDINAFFVENEQDIGLYSNSYRYDKLPQKLSLKAGGFDIGTTYDGFTLVSEHFKVLCEQAGFTNIEFIQLPSLVYYCLRVHNVVEYDTERRGTKFNKLNKATGEYRWVHGATPVYLQKNAEIPEGTIYRTDIFFGEDLKKYPLLLVGKNTKKVMESWKIKSIFFEMILDEYQIKSRK